MAQRAGAFPAPWRRGDQVGGRQGGVIRIRVGYCRDSRAATPPVLLLQPYISPLGHGGGGYSVAAHRCCAWAAPRRSAAIEHCRHNLAGFVWTGGGFAEALNHCFDRVYGVRVGHGVTTRCRGLERVAWWLAPSRPAIPRTTPVPGARRSATRADRTVGHAIILHTALAVLRAFVALLTA
jgi:hypothetical protein